MRHLGIDYGTKKTGLAFSDDSGTMAFPYAIVPTDSLLRYLVELREKESFGAIVMGHSQTGGGEDNPVMKHIYLFQKNLEDTFKIPVYLQNEFGTSAHIHRMNDFLAGTRSDTQRKVKKSTEHVDAGAAALILQRFIDKM